MENQSPVQRIWELGKDEHGRLITAVILAVLGVICGMAPYFAAAKIIVLLLAGETALAAYTPWLIAALAGYAVRTALYNSALSISHKATFNILKTIRELLLVKLPKLPLGTVMDTSSGKLKQIIVDQVDSMETTLAHLFLEMTVNIIAPVLTLIYLFVLDWRLALLSLAVFPVAFIFMMMVMGNYAKDYEGAVQATNEMSGAIIEYIHGIEVIKAFNQGSISYISYAFLTSAMSFGGAIMRLPPSTAVTCSKLSVFCSMAREEYIVRMRLVRRRVGLEVKPRDAFTCPTSSAISAISPKMVFVTSNGGFLLYTFITSQLI